MTEPAPPNSGVPFAELFGALRARGFQLGVEELLRVHQLLGRLPGDIRPGQLRTLLSPIFCRNAREQASFYELFAEMYPLLVETEPRAEAVVESPVPAAIAPAESAPGRPLGGRRWRKTGPWAIAAVGMASAWIVWMAVGSRSPLESPPTETVGEAAGTGATDDPTEVGTQATAEAAADQPAGDESADPTTLDPAADPSLSGPADDASEALTAGPEEEGRGPAPLEGGPEVASPPPTGPPLEPALLLRWLVVVLPLGLLLLTEWRAWSKRQAVVAAHGGKRPPLEWQSFSSDTPSTLLERGSLRQAVRDLSAREPGDAVFLDVPRTIDATIAARGYPSLRFRANTRAPEYVVLIERRSRRDHHSRYFDELVHALAHEELPVTRLFYEADPRVCFRGRRSDRILLQDLRSRFATSRLLVLGDGSGFLDPVSGSLKSWVASLCDWEKRAFLTTRPPQEWTTRELQLASHFAVVPATVGGVGAIAALFEPEQDSQAWAPSDWAGRGSTAASRRTADLSRLEQRLGLEVFRWLCACAVYPELHWALTIRLAQLPVLGDDLLTEENLLELIRLPWFRDGRIPDELRLELIARLDERTEREVRAALVRLLQANLAPAESIAGEQQRAQVAVQRLLQAGSSWWERRKARSELSEFPYELIARDAASIRLVEERASPLSLRLPDAVRRAVFAGGLPFLGMRSAARASVAVLAISVGLLATKPAESGEAMGSVAEGAADCETYDPDYNANGSCFDEPPVPLDELGVPVEPSSSGLPASALMAVRVDQEGRFTTALPVEPSGEPEFDRLVLQAASAVRFQPARKDGAPVPGWTELTFFPLESEVALADAGTTASDTAEVDGAESEGGAVEAGSASETPVEPFALTLDSLALFSAEVYATRSLLPRSPFGASLIDSDSVAWTSLDPEVLSIGEDGQLEALGDGRARIVAAWRGQEDTLIVGVDPSEFTLTEERLYVPTGGMRTIAATLTDSGRPISPDRLRWESGDPDVAILSPQGVVMGMSEGVTELSVSGPGGRQSIEVTVHRPAWRLALDPPVQNVVRIPVGGSVPFRAVPVDSSRVPIAELPVVWAVGDSTVMTVDPSTGAVSGRQAGNSELRVSTPNGTLSTGWLTEVVEARVVALQEEIRLDLGERRELSVGLTDGEGFFEGAVSVEWTSMDPSKVQVSPAGEAIAVGWGVTALFIEGDPSESDTVVAVVRPSGEYVFNDVLSCRLRRGVRAGGCGRLRFIGALQFDDAGGELRIEGRAGGRLCSAEVSVLSTQFTVPCGPDTNISVSLSGNSISAFAVHRRTRMESVRGACNVRTDQRCTSWNYELEEVTETSRGSLTLFRSASEGPG